MVEENKIKVFFVTRGYSIHAKRRIQIFCDDTRFKVAVAANYNYGFIGAENILLDQATGGAPDSGGSKVVVSRWTEFYKNKVRAKLAKVLFLRVCYDVLIGIKDLIVLKKAVKRFAPDVVFLQTLLYPSYLAYFLPKSIPVVVTFWNGDVLWWAKFSGIEKLFKKQIVEYGVKRATAMTVNSKAAYNACLGYGVLADKVHLIQYPGVDREKFKPGSKDMARQKLGIESKKVVFCPRGLASYLNNETIIKAIPEVRSKYPDVLFLFVSGYGRREDWEKLLLQARELGVEGNIRRDGQVSWEEMPVYYNASDVMVSLSSEDSLPNCMLEAMACGIPVVMGDIPQIREWVVDRDNGFLVDTKDHNAAGKSILSVLNDDKEIADFKVRNLEKISKNMDLKKNSAQMKNLVIDIVKESMAN